MDTDGDSNGRDLYAVLGLDHEATMEEIRRAFRTMAARNHPDKNPGDPKAALRFKRINAAFQVLSDPRRKRQYDTLTAPIDELARAPVSVGPDTPAREEIPGGLRRRRVRRNRPANLAWALVLVPITFMVVAFAIPEARVPGVGDSASAVAASGAPMRGASSEPLHPLTFPTPVPVPTSIPTLQRPSVPPALDAPSRSVTGDKWTLALPPDWQETADVAPSGAGNASTNAKVRRWTAPGGGSSLRVGLEVSTLTEEPAAYFEELKRARPAAESWETATKPDGLRREGHVDNGDVLVAKFVEYAITSKGRGYRVTCDAPPEVFDVTLCERILGTLRIR